MIFKLSTAKFRFFALEMAHKSGFVNIIGSPNVGKSTLMNQLVGERMSIISPKAQTTRHRIFGIVNEPDYQIVFSDTPGVVNASYKLHQSMMDSVNTALKDADIILLVTDLWEDSLNHKETLERIQKTAIPTIVLINKLDKGDDKRLKERTEHWHKLLPEADILPISALHGFHTDFIIPKLVRMIPEGPPYFPKDELTDRPLRFFISEIIREKIFFAYEKEIPYSCQVEIEEYKESKRLDKIRAIIYVDRDSQKGILIGHQGKMLKKIGTEARLDAEEMLQKKVHLELFVKVKKDWRNDDRSLKNFGY